MLFRKLKEQIDLLKIDESITVTENEIKEVLPVYLVNDSIKLKDFKMKTILDGISGITKKHIKTPLRIQVCLIQNYGRQLIHIST